MIETAATIVIEMSKSIKNALNWFTYSSVDIIRYTDVF